MNQPTLPDPQTAYNNLFDGIHQRVFFSKCASAGHQPRTVEQAQWMLDTAVKLRQAESLEQVKQAEANNDPYFLMNQRLNGVLEKHGLDGNIKQNMMAEQEMAIKEAAEAFASDPLFYNSVLSLKAAEAAQLQQEYTQWQAQQRA